MIKERFGPSVLLALSSAQCVMHFAAYYHNPLAHSGEWAFGVFFALLTAVLLVFIVWTSFALTEISKNVVWLTVSQYRLLLALSGLLAFAIVMQLWGGMTQVYLTTLPLWLRISTYASLSLAIWQSEYLWGAFLRARRIVRERGFAPEEAKSEAA